MLMRSPGLAQKVWRPARTCRLNSTLSPVEREITIIAVAREKDAAYEWNSHVVTGRNQGMREEAIDAVRGRADVSGWIPTSATSCCTCASCCGPTGCRARCLIRLMERHGERWLVELAATIGQYQYISAINNAFDFQPRRAPIHSPFRRG